MNISWMVCAPLWLGLCPPAVAGDNVIDLTLGVADSCAGAADEMITVSAPIAMPNSVQFLMPPDVDIWPVAITVDNDIRPAGTGQALTTIEPGKYNASTGLRAGGIFIRLKLGRYLLCEARHDVSFFYDLKSASDAELPSVRITVVRSERVGSNITDGGRDVVLSSLDVRLDKRIKYYISDEFSWYDERTGTKDDPSLKERLGYCYRCSEWEAYKLALGLAQLQDSIPPENRIRGSDQNVLQTHFKRVEFPAPNVLRVSFDEETWLEFVRGVYEPSKEEELYLVGLNSRLGGLTVRKSERLSAAEEEGDGPFGLKARPIDVEKWLKDALTVRDRPVKVWPIPPKGPVPDPIWDRNPMGSEFR